MSLNLNKLTKAEILELWNGRCKHGHRYLSHYNCYLTEIQKGEKIGFLDIETSNLNPEFGIVFCWCIKDNDTDKIAHDVVTKDELMSKDEDKRIVASCIQEMQKYDRIVTHFGTYFDIPFLRTKAIIHGLEFPKYKEIYHTDVWRWAKRLLKLHSNRQNIVAEALRGKTVKTRIEHVHWRRGMQGNKKSLKYILNHCVYDVDDLKLNFEDMLPYGNLVKTSI